MKCVTTEITQSGLVCTDLLYTYIQQLVPEIELLKNAHHQNDYAFALLPNDTNSCKRAISLAAAKKQLNPSIIFIIGIGGSNLGTLAIQQALLGELYNNITNNIKIYYIDTTDTTYINQMLNIAESELKRNVSILLNVISKSGKTTETIANFELFLSLLKQYFPNNYNDYVVITTEKNSLLWQLAQKESWQTLDIPTNVGGRFSVFSAVGLFPLAMINVDVENLLKGAQDASGLCLRSDSTNPAALSAAWQYALCKEGYHISNLFVFSNELLGLSRWWKQLVAESLGKETKRDGIPNKDAILPITSLGSADMHSIGQLFLANILPIATTFVTFEPKEKKTILPHYEELFNGLVPNIQGKSLTTISKSILQGIKKTYKIKELPYRTITIPEKNAYCIGQLLQQTMFEIVYLGHLLGVYPFDQPAVELYKQETRKILAHE